MRDKKDATIFPRTLDRSHPSNTRVVVPPKIDSFLGNPTKVEFTIRDNTVIMYAHIPTEKINNNSTN